MIGIYFIKNKQFGYIGLSTNIEQRLSSHKRLIERGTHPNFKGFSTNIDDYIFDVCCICKKEELFIKEKEYYDLYSPNFHMLNIKQCGIGGFSHNVEITNGSKIALSVIGENISIGTTTLDSININGNKLYDVSTMIDIVSCFLGSEKRISQILADNNNIDKLSCLYKLDRNDSFIKEAKSRDLYKTIGARNNRTIYVAKEILLLLYAECHPYCYAEYIHYITNTIFEL